MENILIEINKTIQEINDETGWDLDFNLVPNSKGAYLNVNHPLWEFHSFQLSLSSDELQNYSNHATVVRSRIEATIGSRLKERQAT